MKGNKGRRNRIVCSCGSNTFPECPTNDKGNPLADIQGAHTLPMTECSLLKQYTGNKEQIGKKIRDKFAKMALNKAKKKKLGSLFEASKNASEKLSMLLSPKRTENTKNALARSAKNLEDEEDTIGKMERELEELNIDNRNI